MNWQLRIIENLSAISMLIFFAGLTMKVATPGFAMLAALAFIFVGSAMVIQLAADNKRHANIVASYEERLEAMLAQESGLARLFSSLADRNDPLRGRIVAGGEPFVWDFEGALIELKIEAEGSKIDVNSAPIILIENALSASGLADGMIQDIVGRIVNARQSGVRLVSFALFEPAWTVARIPFSPAAIFTFSSGRGKIAPHAAHPIVLESIPDLSENEVSALLASRLETRGQPARVQSEYFGQPGNIYSLVAAVADDEERRTRGRAMISIVDPARPPEILTWQSNSPW